LGVVKKNEKLMLNKTPMVGGQGEGMGQGIWVLFIKLSLNFETSGYRGFEVEKRFGGDWGRGDTEMEKGIRAMFHKKRRWGGRRSNIKKKKGKFKG